MKNKKHTIFSIVKKTGYGILDAVGFGTFLVVHLVITGVTYIFSKKDKNQIPLF